MSKSKQTSLKKNALPEERPSKGKILALLPQYLICAIVSIFILVPLFTAFLGGFKTTGELFSTPFGLPAVWHWETYYNILINVNNDTNSFWRELLNSTIIMVATVTLVLFVSSMAAFIFARFIFPGRELIFNFFTIGMLLPLSVTILPLYILLRQLGLLDNYLGIILPQVAFGLPGSIFILRGFFKNIPGELEDAAYIDGCTPFGFYWRILLPLARPALASVAVLTIVASWNAFILPLLVLTKPELLTLPLGLMQFQGQYGTDWPSIMAFVSLTMVPAIAFYIVAERQMISGLTAGAIKG